MAEEYQDKTLICRDTGKEFVFTAGEQEFYAKKGWPDPVRSPEARKAKKLRQAQKEQNEEFGFQGHNAYHAEKPREGRNER